MSAAALAKLLLRLTAVLTYAVARFKLLSGVVDERDLPQKTPPVGQAKNACLPKLCERVGGDLNFALPCFTCKVVASLFFFFLVRSLPNSACESCTCVSVRFLLLRLLPYRTA